MVLYDPDSEPTTTPSKYLTNLNQSESFSGIFFFFQLGTRDKDHSFADGEMQDVSLKNSVTFPLLIAEEIPL